MSSHDATTPDQAPANVATRGPDERTETVLRRLEAHMAKSRLRGHIYLTERNVVEFATRQKRTDRPLERNVGPEPVRHALGEILGPRRRSRRAG